jgi:hypothetical protein
MITHTIAPTHTGDGVVLTERICSVDAIAGVLLETNSNFGHLAGSEQETHYNAACHKKPYEGCRSCNAKAAFVNLDSRKTLLRQAGRLASEGLS